MNWAGMEGHQDMKAGRRAACTESSESLVGEEKRGVLGTRDMVVTGRVMKRHRTRESGEGQDTGLA